MVLIMKYNRGVVRIASHEFNAVLVRLVKYMINMEYNEKIFDETGAYIPSRENERRSEFLVYKDPVFDTEYSITPSNGSIVLTSLIPGYTSINAIIDELSSIFDAIGNVYPDLVSREKLIPTSYGSLHPTTYGTILYHNTHEHWNRVIIAEPAVAALSKMSGEAFIWAIYLMDKRMGKMIVSDNIPRTENAIYSDLSTIIVDMFNCFTQVDNTLQLSAIKASDIKGADRVVYSQVLISQIYGLHFAISSIHPGGSVSINSDSLNTIRRIEDMRRSCKLLMYETEYDELPELEKVSTWTRNYNAPADQIYNHLQEHIPTPVVNTNSDSDDDGDNQMQPPPPQPTQPTNRIQYYYQQLIVDNGGDIQEMRNDICLLCKIPLYRKVYVLQSITTHKCIGLCEPCLLKNFNGMDITINKPHCVVWKTVYPRSFAKILDDPSVVLAANIAERIHNGPSYLSLIKRMHAAEIKTIYRRYAKDTEVKKIRGINDAPPKSRRHRRWWNGANANANANANDKVEYFDTIPISYGESKIDRWQFMFKGTYASSTKSKRERRHNRKCEAEPFTIYVINDINFCMGDYELLHEPNTYIALGGL